MKKYSIFLFLCLSFVYNATAFASTIDSAEEIDHNQPQDLTSCSTFYQKQEPAFYTGFAPRSRDAKRLHLHVGRGNQLRATLVLSDEVLESYLRDIFTRYVSYHTMIDEGNLHLTQNSAFEEFEKRIESENLHNLIIEETEMSRQDAVMRNLQTLQHLNPGRVFHITTPVQDVIQQWLDALQESDYKKPDTKQKLTLLNDMLPTRLWLTVLDKDISTQLDNLLQQAAVSKTITDDLSSQYLTLLDKISGGIYPRTGDSFDFHEFTAIFPIGTFNEYTTCAGDVKIPMYPTPGRWTLTTHQRSKTVDHIPEINIYSWFPWIPYMHVGSKLHNSFHTLWWQMEHEKTAFLPEELQKPEQKGRDGKKYRYLWLLSRGPMSHGCTHVNGGHILELRQMLPSAEKEMYNVVFYLNKSCLFDVFDIDGDLNPEIMGVRYFVAYTLKNKKPGVLRAPMERKPYYKWLYGGVLKYEENGQGYFENIRDGRFLEKRAVNGKRYKRLPLYEAPMEPFNLQFFKMQDIPHIRELRKAGDDYK